MPRISGYRTITLTSTINIGFFVDGMAKGFAILKNLDDDSTFESNCKWGIPLGWAKRFPGPNSDPKDFTSYGDISKKTSIIFDENNTLLLIENKVTNSRYKFQYDDEKVICFGKRLIYKNNEQVESTSTKRMVLIPGIIIIVKDNIVMTYHLDGTTNIHIKPKETTNAYDPEERINQINIENNNEDKFDDT